MSETPRIQVFVGERRPAVGLVDHVQKPWPHPHLPGLHRLEGAAYVLPDPFQALRSDEGTGEQRVVWVQLVQLRAGLADDPLFLITEARGTPVEDEGCVVHGVVPSEFERPHAEVVLLAVAAGEALRVEEANLVEGRAFDVHAEAVGRRGCEGRLARSAG